MAEENSRSLDDIYRLIVEQGRAQQESLSEGLAGVHRRCGKIEEKLGHVRAATARNAEALTHFGITQESAQRDRETLRQEVAGLARKLNGRLTALETVKAFEDGRDAGEKSVADLWRDRIYTIARYVLPPSAAAGLAIWAWERFGGG